MTCNDLDVRWDDQITKGYCVIRQTHLVIWNLHLVLENLSKTPYLGKMTKFGNLVLKKAQNTKKGLELVMSFLTLPREFTILMAHHPRVHFLLPCCCFLAGKILTELYNNLTVEVLSSENSENLQFDPLAYLCVELSVRLGNSIFPNHERARLYMKKQAEVISKKI